MVGRETARRLADTTTAVYNYAHGLALSVGIVIADTKLEFGFIDGRLTAIDELLTPDSSRFWDAEGYEPGKSQPNFDKQFVRTGSTRRAGTTSLPPEASCRRCREDPRTVSRGVQEADRPGPLLEPAFALPYVRVPR